VSLKKEEIKNKMKQWKASFWDNQEEEHRKKIYAFLMLFSIFVVTFGTTYAFFSYSKMGTKDNIITTPGKATFVYTEDKNGVTLENAIPIPVDQGKTLTDSYDFSIAANVPKETNLNYTISLINVTEPKDGKTALSNSHIRVFLTDDLDQPLMGTSSFPKADSDGTILMSNVITSGDEGILYVGAFESGNTSTNYSKNFKIRAWIDEKADLIASSIGGTLDVTDNGSGVIPDSDRYETDGEYVKFVYGNKTYSFKVKLSVTMIDK